MAEVSSAIIERFLANLAGALATAGRSQSQPHAAGRRRTAGWRSPSRSWSLQARLVHSLQGEGINTVSQIVSRTESELLSIRNLGQKSVSEIEQRLGDLGLSLARQAKAGPAEQSAPGSARAGRRAAGRVDGQSAAGQSAAGESAAEQRGAEQGAGRILHRRSRSQRSCLRCGSCRSRRQCRHRQCRHRRCDRHGCPRQQRGMGRLAAGRVDGRRELLPCGSTSRRMTRSTCLTWLPGRSSSGCCPRRPPPSC